MIDLRTLVLFVAWLGGFPLPAQQTPRVLRTVDLSGTPYERGMQHGKALATEIRALVAAFEQDLSQTTGQPAGEFVQRFLRETQYDAAIRRVTPGLLDEVRGLAEGAGQPFETMLVYQLIDELWAQAPSMPREKCTSVGLAARGDQPTVVAQNLDVPQWMHSHPTVLRIQHADSLQSLVVTLPGLIGAMGMNSGRVAVACNTILQLAARRDGLPVAFVVRGLLEQPDDAAARAFVRRVQHACGQAYTIGGPELVTCHEASANKVVPFVPASGPARVWHTNHPVASDDFAPSFVAAVQRTGKEPGAVKFGCARFAAVERGLAANEAATVDQCIDLLADPQHRVCNALTYVCIVMTLGERPELRITPGAPDKTPFETVGFAAGR